VCIKSRNKFTKNKINTKPEFKKIKKPITNQKIIDSINKHVQDLPKLTQFQKFKKIVFSTMTLPFNIYSVSYNHVLLYFTFGKYDGYRTSGFTFVPIFSERIELFCGDIILKHTNMHLTDSESNPIIASSFVIYNITNPVNYILNLKPSHELVDILTDYSSNVLTHWIENIVRKEISMYSYIELTSDQKENITLQLINKINSDPRADFYGIEIQKAGLLEIKYSPKIAEIMLVKQKAKAIIEARKESVDASLNLIKDISQKLDDKLTQEDKSKLITCLTVSMIGNNTPSDIFNINQS